MSTVMSRDQRESFLTSLHVGTLSVASTVDERAPLAVPIWYDYSPAAGVRIITSRLSRKGVAIERAGRFALVVQDESLPYRYVSVDGPVVETRPGEQFMVERADGELLFVASTRDRVEPARLQLRRGEMVEDIDVATGDVGVP